jgi:hypothetical protein
MPRPQRDDDDEDAPERPRRKPPEPAERDEGVEPAERVRKPRPPREEEYEEDDRPRARRRRYEDKDDDEDRPRRRRRRRKEAIEGLIPYHNPKSLAAYYCGVFGMIPVLGLILGPIALILGIQGIRFARKHDAGGMGHSIAGLILGILVTLLNWGGAVFGVYFFNRYMVYR